MCLPTISYAQQSALTTSGMGGGTSNTAKLTAQITQQQGRCIDAFETCSNKGRLYGPAFAGAKDTDDCLTALNIKTDGKVGIGTLPPKHQLQVNGDAQVNNLSAGITTVSEGVNRLCCI